MSFDHSACCEYCDDDWCCVCEEWLSDEWLDEDNSCGCGSSLCEFAYPLAEDDDCPDCTHKPGTHG